jgi:hypothetical protein
MTRHFEKSTCPECARSISAYVPHFGDGSDVRIVPHNRLDSRGGHDGICPASGKMRREYLSGECFNIQPASRKESPRG